MEEALSVDSTNLIDSISENLTGCNAVQPSRRKRNRRKEKSSKEKLVPQEDSVAQISTQLKSFELGTSTVRVQTDYSVESLMQHSTIEDTASKEQNGTNTFQTYSPTKKKKRLKKKNTAMTSIQKLSEAENANSGEVGPSFPPNAESIINLPDLCSPLRLSPSKNRKHISCEGEQHLSMTKSPTKSKKQRKVSHSAEFCNSSSARTARDPRKHHSTRETRSGVVEQMLMQNKFEEHLQRELVDIMLQEQPTVVKGFLRINQRNYREAYISSSDGSKDILIDGVKDRNRALEGDEVAVQLFPKSQWKQHEGAMQKVGKVIHILNQIHQRQAVGSLKKLHDGNSRRVLFSPRDSRIPRMHIPINECPKDIKLWETCIFQARIVEWVDVRYAKGRLLSELIGTQGDIEAETRAILLENEIKSSPYAKCLHQYFCKPPYEITEEQIQNRADLRKQCVFTIDPLTARDLDDAMSCEKLENGNFKVGVHISDVSFFLEEGTPLDKEIAERATTTYLVQRAYHMLPVEMTMMCSLLPGEDKLAFSVFWEITPEAEVVSHYFTRSVIHSCAQLAYEHAQLMIDKPGHNWKSSEHPKIYGGWTIHDLKEVVLSLQSLAAILRKRRFDTGALRVDQTKLMFRLGTDGQPIGFSAHVSKESHSLIEEFMLLANMTVATDLQKRFPDIAFLRCHDEPQSDMLNKLASTLETFGIILDISSAGSIHQSLQRYCSSGDAAQTLALNSLCSRPMVRARYFCAAAIHDVMYMRHFALNVPLYTHFTSPIRRYADVMVHRLLCAHLGYCEEPKWTIDYVQSVAANCNKMKYCAKKAGEQSTELFMAVWIKNNGTIKTEAVVVDVKDHSFDAIICSTGTNVRVYTDKLAASVVPESKPVPQLKISWAMSKSSSHVTQQVITLFSVVQVALCTSTTNNLKIEAFLLPPECGGME